MSIASVENELPPQFQDLDAFQNWVRASFGDHATTVVKGRRWRNFVCELIPLTDFGRNYPALTPSAKESDDGGVDAQSDANDEGRFLVLQSKLDVVDKIKLDSVLSAFRSFESQIDAEDGRLFSLSDEAAPRPVYVVACSNPLARIIDAYEATNLGSRQFYDELVAEQRLKIFDGGELLGELKAAWRMSFSVPRELRINSSDGWLRSGEVSVGLISGLDLAELARMHGSGLFFENVRDFLGLGKNTDRTTVNQAIQTTARESPSKMLARNNGIVFRAKAVDEEPGNVLVLQDASIVNGCQTTMCLAHLAAVEQSCQVVAKVVCADDAWEVAEAANNQNSIAQIDLKLARFLRKQIAQKAAAEAGVTLRNHTEPEGVGKVISALREEETSYDQLRYLYIGLFSSKPNHLWDDNYNRLLESVLNVLYASDQANEQQLFETLFALLGATREGLALCQRLNGEDDPLSRAHDDSRPKYRVYIALLALCATLADNLAERSDAVEEEAQRMAAFIETTKALLEDPASRKQFVRNFAKAYSVLGELALEEHEDDARGKVAQRVQSKLASASFSSLYGRLRRRIETDRLLSEVS